MDTEEVSVHEFRRDLRGFLAAGAEGREVVVTRYGQPLVRLVPVSDPEEEN